jgi:hypothetical protein
LPIEPAKDAAKRLNVSDAMLSIYVKEGRLHRYGPSDRQHKFYKISELDALIEARQTFEEVQVYKRGQWKFNETSTFRRATSDDLDAIIAMSERAYPEEGLPLRKTWEGWMRKEPESFYVLVNQQNVIVGYSTILAMPSATLNSFMRDELPVDEIGPEKLDVFHQGEPLHLYLMSLVIDPQHPKRNRHEYGSRLIHGVFSFFLDLAERGIEVETITARSHTRDGIRLMQRLGFPLVKSPVPRPGRYLFVLKVSESGLPLFEHYSELLAQWKQRQETLAAKKTSDGKGKKRLV